VGRLLGAVLLAMSAQAIRSETKPVMTATDVVFMYGADPEFYDQYGATWVAWGGGVGKRPGIHYTGTFWCLTAGPENLHKDPALRDAVAKDIEGYPIWVPWQMDSTFEGTPTWFGCTNAPAYLELLRKRCLEAVADNPGGIHIDDPAGVYAPVSWGGGCFCDYCMNKFTEYLVAHDSSELRKVAEVASFKNFDYRELVRKRAKTKDEYLKVQNDLPLRKEYLDCQEKLMVENIRWLGGLAREKLGPAMTLSVNLYYGGPGGDNLVLVPEITHMVAEVEHEAGEGTDRLMKPVMAYRQAETVGKPLASTASGSDYAWVKEHNAVNLVKIWIALSYACGQRLMVPHPKMQWCHTPEKGTHWYAAPVKEFAPLYRFVRANPGLFEGYATIGPLAPPADTPKEFDTPEKRRALKEALERGNPEPLHAGDKVWVFPRMKPSGELVVHLLNIDYTPDGDRIVPARKVRVRIPAVLAGKAFRNAVAHSYDHDPVALKVEREGEDLVVTLPELRVWTVLEFR
jgi:hypothetical protein